MMKLDWKTQRENQFAETLTYFPLGPYILPIGCSELDHFKRWEPFTTLCDAEGKPVVDLSRPIRYERVSREGEVFISNYPQGIHS